MCSLLALKNLSSISSVSVQIVHLCTFIGEEVLILEKTLNQANIIVPSGHDAFLVPVLCRQNTSGHFIREVPTIVERPTSLSKDGQVRPMQSQHYCCLMSVTCCNTAVWRSRSRNYFRDRPPVFKTDKVILRRKAFTTGDNGK